MFGPTHARYAAAASTAAVLAFHPATLSSVGTLIDAGVAFGVGGVVGLIPDLDTDQSTIVRWPSRTLHRLWRRRQLTYKLTWLVVALPFLVVHVALLLISAVVSLVSGGHRGLTHHPLVWGILSYAVARWLPAELALPLIVGYGAHLATDALTVSGLPLWGSHHLHLLPRRLCVNMTTERGKRWELRYRHLGTALCVGVIGAALVQQMS